MMTKFRRRAPRTGRAYWLHLLKFALLVSTLAGLGLFTYLLQRQLEVIVLPQRKPITESPADWGLPYQEVRLTTIDGLTSAAWYIPGSRPEAIILVHGIHANRQVMLPTAALLAEAGYPLLLIDLRGHGESDASDLTYGYREAFDVQAGAAYLAGRPEIEHIGVLGTSMGGAAVARAAAIEPRLEAVVIQSSYSSMTNAIEDAFNDFSIFPKWPFAPLIVWLVERRVGVQHEQIDSMQALAATAPRPVMIIHGRHDGLFPVHHAEALYQAAGSPKTLWIMETLTHGDPAREIPVEYQAHLLAFFEQAFSP